MKNRKELKKIIRYLEQSIEVRDREIVELLAELRQVKGDAFDMLNHGRVR